MSKGRAFLSGLLAGLAAFGAALVAVLMGRESHARDRYRIQEEVEDEIERKGREAGEKARDEVLGSDPHDVVAGLSPEARTGIAVAIDDAIERAKRLSHLPDRDGAAGNP